MTDHDLPNQSDALLEAKRQVALRATERLLATCGNHEPEIWLSRYQDVRDALRQGRVGDAIFADCRLEYSPGMEYGNPVWLVSKKMAMDVKDAMNRIRMHIYYGDHSAAVEAPIRPVDATLRGTVEQDEERRRKRHELRYPEIRDPIESDPEYRIILKIVDRLAEEALRAQGVEQFLGYCHIFWDEKRRILKEEYGIDWQSPRELNPNTMYD